MAKLFSDRVRQFDATVFKAIKVGERFRFGSEVDWPFSGMKTGVAVKISARKYRYESDGTEYVVGSVKAVVVRVDESGQMRRFGTPWTPYLGD
jgi:hypothetical protein